MTQLFKYQENFARELAESWINGNKNHVRNTIRSLKNRAQSAFIASKVSLLLMIAYGSHGDADDFVNFIHPNNK